MTLLRVIVPSMESNLVDSIGKVLIEYEGVMRLSRTEYIHAPAGAIK
jgi:hypothetical protein